MQKQMEKNNADGTSDSTQNASDAMPQAENMQSENAQSESGQSENMQMMQTDNASDMKTNMENEIQNLTASFECFHRCF